MVVEIDDGIVDLLFLYLVLCWIVVVVVFVVI